MRSRPILYLLLVNLLCERLGDEEKAGCARIDIRQMNKGVYEGCWNGY